MDRAYLIYKMDGANEGTPVSLGKLLRLRRAYLHNLSIENLYHLVSGDVCCPDCGAPLAPDRWSLQLHQTGFGDAQKISSQFIHPFSPDEAPDFVRSCPRYEDERDAGYGHIDKNETIRAVNDRIFSFRSPIRPFVLKAAWNLLYGKMPFSANEWEKFEKKFNRCKKEFRYEPFLTAHPWAIVFMMAGMNPSNPYQLGAYRDVVAVTYKKEGVQVMDYTDITGQARKERMPKNLQADLVLETQRWGRIADAVGKIRYPVSLNTVEELAGEQIHSSYSRYLNLEKIVKKRGVYSIPKDEAPRRTDDRSFDMAGPIDPEKTLFFRATGPTHTRHPREDDPQLSFDMGEEPTKTLDSKGLGAKTSPFHPSSPVLSSAGSSLVSFAKPQPYRAYNP
jgi:hypothetical protein